MKSKLSEAQIKELLEAYDQWNPHDPNSGSVAELAARFGISKQTLYTYVKERKRDRKDRREDFDEEKANLIETVGYLTRKLLEAEKRIAELEGK